MNQHPTGLEGAISIDLIHFPDERGSFVKIFNKVEYKEAGFDLNFDETYYSVSKKGVIRGMHFQIPPHEHYKLVYAAAGTILDVILDIRKSSTTYGQHFTIELSAENKKALYIPVGFAHGFTALSETATMVYNVSTVYSPGFEGGILWYSFGYDWPFENPILSERDSSLTLFKEYSSPF